MPVPVTQHLVRPSTQLASATVCTSSTANKRDISSNSLICPTHFKKKQTVVLMPCLALGRQLLPFLCDFFSILVDLLRGWDVRLWSRMVGLGLETHYATLAGPHPAPSPYLVRVVGRRTMKHRSRLVTIDVPVARVRRNFRSPRASLQSTPDQASANGRSSVTATTLTTDDHG
jgi:hypothetical protein